MRRSTERLERLLPDPDVWDAPDRLIERDLYLHDGLSARTEPGESNLAGDEQ